MLSVGSPFRVFFSTHAGHKPLFFQWMKNGLILNNSPQTNYKIDNSDDHSMFLIKNVDRSDAGNYSCAVRNAFGEDYKQTQLSIKGLRFTHLFFSWTKILILFR